MEVGPRLGGTGTSLVMCIGLGTAAPIVAAASAPLVAKPLLSSGELAGLALAVELAGNTADEQEALLEDPPVSVHVATHSGISNQSFPLQNLTPWSRTYLIRVQKSSTKPTANG